MIGKKKKVSQIAKSVSVTHKKDKPELIFLNTSDIGFGKFLHRDYTATSNWPGQAKKSIARNDILFSEIRPANGRWAFVDFDAADYVVSTKLMVIRVDENVMLPQFFYIWLTSLAVVERLQALAESRSGTFPQITFDDIGFLELPLPSIEEQHSIVATLSVLDDKIDLNRRMNETLEAMARALFKDWFVDFGPTRAKMAGREPYLAQDIWDLFPDKLDEDGKPEGWASGTLADIAESPRRGVSPADVKEDTPYIGLEHMPRRSIALADWEGAGKVTSNKSAFKKGEFLFGKLRPYFHKVGFAPLDGICSTDIVVVRPKQPEWGAITLACISTDEFVEYTDKTSTGTKMPRTSWSIMGQFKMCLLPQSISYIYQNTVQILFDRVCANIHESQTLSQTRDLLLPKLMSGEIRVGDAEQAVQEVV